MFVGGKASEEFLTSAIHFGQELDQGWTWIGSSNDNVYVNVNVKVMIEVSNVSVNVNVNLRILEKTVPSLPDF